MIFYFSISIIIIFFLHRIIGRFYALDRPNLRKRHLDAIPQIGGIDFGPIMIFNAWWLGLVSSWYVIGGLITILLGMVDDLYHVPWKIKFVTQMSLALYIASIFWGSFDTIIFYNYAIPITQVLLLVLFLFWCIGIYNAVNLLDGLDLAEYFITSKAQKFKNKKKEEGIKIL